jgi:hypothetical protein
LFEESEISTKPGKVIGVWRDAPGLGRDIRAGYYRVVHWPIYADGMIEGYFFPDALSFVGELDVAGLRAAEEEQAMAGPMCDGCQAEALRRCAMHQCFLGTIDSGKATP